MDSLTLILLLFELLLLSSSVYSWGFSWVPPKIETGLKFYIGINVNFTEETYQESFIQIDNFTDPAKFQDLDLNQDSSSSNDYNYGSTFLLKELSFCGDFRSLVMLTQTLFSIGEVFVVRLLSPKIGLIEVQLDRSSYLVRTNVPFLPKRWHRLCLAIRESGVMSVYFDGDNVFNKTLVDPMKLSLQDLLAQGLTLGFSNTKVFKGSDLQNNKFHGVMFGLSLWSSALSDAEMVAITGPACKSAKNPDLLNWDSVVKGRKNTPMIKTYTLIRSCAERDDTEPNLYPVKEEFLAATVICRSLGGKMVVPKNETDLDRINKKLDEQYHTLEGDCDGEPWIGVMKNGSDESYIDIVNSTSVSFLPFTRGEPNGGHYENCLALDTNDGGYHDHDCYHKRCPVCDLNRDHVTLELKGNLHIDNEFVLDKKYSLDKTSGYGLDQFVGTTGSLIHLEDGQWYLSDMFLGHKGHRFAHLEVKKHPLGLGEWHISIPSEGHENTGRVERELLLSTCGPDEFTCHTYGDCIPITKRCNGKFDCVEGDLSDEEQCNIVNLNHETYNQGKPPKNETGERLKIDVQLRVDTIADIDELGQTITMRLKVVMSWHDNQLTFNNLNENKDYNNVNDNIRDRLWVPVLVILNSIGLGLTQIDETSVMTVMRMGNYTLNSEQDVYEDFLYSGTENPLVLSSFIMSTLHCRFDLTMFPFDMQRCPIGLLVPGFLGPHIDIQLVRLGALYDDIDLIQYDFIGFDYDEKDFAQGHHFSVDVKLKRIYTYHLAATFMPTLCLVLISELTLFIKEAHFEATIMVALTTMLVMYTLFQSVGNSLPQTSYLKMIDVWLLAGLIVPFIVILILIASDSINDDIDGQSQDISLSKRGKHLDKYKRKKWAIVWAKRFVILSTLAFVVAYAIKAAQTYNQHV